MPLIVLQYSQVCAANDFRGRFIQKAGIVYTDSYTGLNSRRLFDAEA